MDVWVYVEKRKKNTELRELLGLEAVIEADLGGLHMMNIKMTVIGSSSVC